MLLLSAAVVLAMHYTPHVVCAGVSIEHILRSVYGGWMIRLFWIGWIADHRKHTVELAPLLALAR